MLKPSYMSLEGQSMAVVLGGCLGCLYVVLGGDASDLPTLDTLPESAAAAKPLLEAYFGQVSDTGEALNLGKVGAILVFMYKIYSKFSDGRTELKKKDIETPSEDLE